MKGWPLVVDTIVEINILIYFIIGSSMTKKSNPQFIRIEGADYDRTQYNQEKG